MVVEDKIEEMKKLNKRQTGFTGEIHHMTSDKVMISQTARDYFKNEIKVGDMVTYPSRQGSSMWMNYGWVTSIGMKSRNSWASNDSIIPCLNVKKVQTDYLGKITGYKNVQLECLDRVVALGRHPVAFMPNKARDEFRTTWLDKVMKWLRR